MGRGFCNQDAETIARMILNEVIGRFGCPLRIHSDQGGNYESRLFSELCELMEIRKTRTSTRNPKCNGKTERFNKTLVPMIRSYLKDQEDWDLNLGCLASAYRASPNETTGVTPNLLMLGKEVRIPAEIVFGSATVTGKESVSSYSLYVERLKKDYRVLIVSQGRGWMCVLKDRKNSTTVNCRSISIKRVILSGICR